jgi:CubicO group peptidase (beta-lactamase class C family)
MYHAITWGWLVDELIRRVDGRTAGQFFADEFAAPLDLEVWIGLPDELHWHATTMVAPDGVLVDEPHTDPLLQLNRNPLWVPGAEKIWNSTEYRSAGLAAVGGFATARGMARFYASLLGEGVLTTETVELGRREIRRGIEPTWGSEIAYGAGFELHVPAAHLGRPTDAFGHAGAGGSRHGAWPNRGISFSYVMNEVRARPDDRAPDLLAALDEPYRQPAVEFDVSSGFRAALGEGDLSWGTHVREVHGPGTQGGRAGSGRGQDAQPRPHRDRAHPARPDPRG